MKKIILLCTTLLVLSCTKDEIEDYNIIEDVIVDVIDDNTNTNVKRRRN